MAVRKINTNELSEIIDKMLSEELSRLKKNEVHKDDLQKYLDEHIIGMAKQVVNEDKNNRMDKIVNEAIKELISDKEKEEEKVSEFKKRLMENIDNILDEVFEEIKKK